MSITNLLFPPYDQRNLIEDHLHTSIDKAIDPRDYPAMSQIVQLTTKVAMAMLRTLVAILEIPLIPLEGAGYLFLRITGKRIVVSTTQNGEQCLKIFKQKAFLPYSLRNIRIAYSSLYVCAKTIEISFLSLFQPKTQ